MAQGLGLRRLHGLHEQLLLAGQACFQRLLAGDAHCLEGQVRGDLAAPLAVLLRGVGGEVVGRQGLARLGIRGGRLGRGAGLQQFAGVGAGLAQQRVGRGGQTVDQTQFEGTLGTQRLAGEDRFQGGFGADQARQALGAAGAGEQAQGDFRETEARLGLADTVAAGQGQLQTAAEGEAADGRDHGLAAAGQLDEQLGQGRGVEGGAAELGDVGAGAERQVVSVDDHRPDRRIGAGLAEGRLQLLAQGKAEGIDRRAAQADQGQFVIQGVVDQGVHGGPLVKVWPVRLGYLAWLVRE
ncbi:hypothetical protein D3C78_1091220 [compost metagenome]